MGDRFIKIWGNWEYHWLSKDPDANLLFMHLLCKAQFVNRTTYTPRGQALHAGELVTSLAKLAECTGFSVKKVRTNLQKLVLGRVIAKIATRVGTKISILKWDRYQGLNATGVRDTVQHGAHRGHTGGTKGATLEEGRRKKEEHICSKEDFQALEVYNIYPKKIGKKKGLAKLKSALKAGLDVQRVIRACENYSKEVKGKDMQYIKQFDTFVGCWEDWEHFDNSSQKEKTKTLEDFVWIKAGSAGESTITSKN